ncbi:hypothetical protein HZS_1095 [Henneguya salminicola]|nr:hypothetical protein HZS_1095 [Henneguya salminicola]
MVGFNTKKILKMNPQNIIDARRAAYINDWRQLSLMENKLLKKAHIPIEHVTYIPQGDLSGNILKFKVNVFGYSIQIPSKSSVYFKIREIRNILNLNSIQTVRQPPLKANEMINHF